MTPGICDSQGCESNIHPHQWSLLKRATRNESLIPVSLHARSSRDNPLILRVPQQRQPLSCKSFFRGFYKYHALYSWDLRVRHAWRQLLLQQRPSCKLTDEVPPRSLVATELSTPVTTTVPKNSWKKRSRLLYCLL